MSRTYAEIAARVQLANIARPGEVARRGLYVIAALLGLTTIWAAATECDVCAEGEGELLPHTRLQKVAPPVSGTIERFLVTDGSVVKRGDALVSLNKIEADAELDRANQQLDALQIERQVHAKTVLGLREIIANPFRLNDTIPAGLPEGNEIAGNVYTAGQELRSAIYDATASGAEPRDKTDESLSPSKASDLCAAKSNLVAGRDARKRAINARASEQSAVIRKLESEIALLESDVSKTRAILGEQEASLADARGELAIYEKGKALGVASGVKFLEAQNYVHQREYAVLETKTHLADLEQQQRSLKLDLQSATVSYRADRADMRAQLNADDARIIRLPLAVRDTEKNVQAKRADYDIALYHAKARLTKELLEIDRLDKRIGEAKSSVELLTELANDRTIRAPIDGIVSQCSALAPGELVERGQHLMTLVPSEQRLVLQSHVKSADIGFVKVGQDVRLRVDAYPCEEFGVIRGKVSRVENYPEVSDDKRTTVSTYRVDVLPERDWISVGPKRADLKVGMNVHADVVVRRRSVIQLLLDPLLKTQG